MSAKKDRNAAVIEMRLKTGVTFDVIAKEFGISRGRAQQIFHKYEHGLVMRARLEERRQEEEAAKREREGC